jgi:hypothetical protein
MKYLTIFFILALSACGSKFDSCIDEQREMYRLKNPNAPHSQITSQYQRFQMVCSEFKDK